MGFVRFLTERGAVVVGAARNPDGAKEMNELLATSPGSFSVVMDLKDDASIRSAAQTVAEKVESLDVLINNAGISSKNHPNDPVMGIDGDELMDVKIGSSVCTVVQRGGSSVGVPKARCATSSKWSTKCATRPYLWYGLSSS